MPMACNLEPALPCGPRRKALIGMQNSGSTFVPLFQGNRSFEKASPRLLRQGVFVGLCHTPCSPPCQGGQNAAAGRVGQPERLTIRQPSTEPFLFDPFRVGALGAFDPGWRDVTRHPGLFTLVPSGDLLERPLLVSSDSTYG